MSPPAKLTLPLVLGLAVLLAVLALRPDLDLAAVRLFYVGDGRFVGDTRAGVIVRYAAWALPFVTYLTMVVLALLGGRRQPRPRWAPPGRAILGLTLSLALGPGLLVHATLKELSHRPRPYAVAAFGGHNAFRPFDQFDGACVHNCAFPSGETAAATWMIAPASLVPPPWRSAALAGALAFAAATGTLRMAFGAHFLSDVAGAALITILVVVATARFVGRARGSPQ